MFKTTISFLFYELNVASATTKTRNEMGEIRESKGTPSQQRKTIEKSLG